MIVQRWLWSRFNVRPEECLGGERGLSMDAHGRVQGLNESRAISERRLSSPRPSIPVSELSRQQRGGPASQLVWVVRIRGLSLQVASV